MEEAQGQRSEPENFPFEVKQGGGVGLMVFGAIFFLAGLAPIGFGVYTYLHHQHLAEEGEKVDGEVVEIVKDRDTDTDGDVDISYYPIVEYPVGDGETLEFEHNVGSGTPSYSEGETVEVLYDPEAPTDAMMALESSGYEAVIAPIVMGLLFSGVGGGIFGFQIRRRLVRRRLFSRGTAIEAEVRGFIETNVKSNRRRLMRMVAVPRDRERHGPLEFRSPLLRPYFHPGMSHVDTEQLEQSKLGKLAKAFIPEGQDVDLEVFEGYPVTVYVDPKRPDKRHAIDMSPLERLPSL